jgi:hypothetical protein
MSNSPFSNAPVLLWGSLNDLHCSLTRCTDGPPFEISVFSGAHRIKRLAFEHDEDASDFAIAEMKASEDTPSLPQSVQSAEPSAPSDPSDD